MMSFQYLMQIMLLRKRKLSSNALVKNMSIFSTLIKLLRSLTLSQSEFTKRKSKSSIQRSRSQTLSLNVFMKRKSISSIRRKLSK